MVSFDISPVAYPQRYKECFVVLVDQRTIPFQRVSISYPARTMNFDVRHGRSYENHQL